MTAATAAALLALVCTTPARSAEPMQPIEKWNVDFGDAHCIALRNYGSPANPVRLGLKPSPIGDVMQVSVLRTAANKQVDQFDGTLTLDRASPRKVSILGYGSKSGKTRISTINLPLSTFQAIRGASSLRVRSPGEVDLAFALSQMEPVARALDRCVAGLRKMWHLGEHSAAIKTEASLDKPLRKLFSSNDYPGDAVIANASGTVGLIMLIDETGKTASCMITQASGRASLDAQSCAIIATRGRFSPALGADGKPIKSGTTGRINWKMP